MAKGYIYVITNEGKPGLCKVGFTERNPEDRAKELDGTHDPFPHEVAYAVKLDDAKKIEKKIHEELMAYRVGSSAEKTGREWFRCSVSQCKDVIRKYDSFPDELHASHESFTFNSPPEDKFICVTGDEKRCRIACYDHSLSNVYYQVQHEDAEKVVRILEGKLHPLKDTYWIKFPAEKCVDLLKRFLAGEDLDNMDDVIVHLKKILPPIIRKPSVNPDPEKGIRLYRQLLQNGFRPKGKH